jgi:hypothetical protein
MVFHIACTDGCQKALLYVLLEVAVCVGTPILR